MYEWCAAYVGLLRIEPLSDEANERWLAQECPGTMLASDNLDRRTRRQ